MPRTSDGDSEESKESEKSEESEESEEEGPDTKIWDFQKTTHRRRSPLSSSDFFEKKKKKIGQSAMSKRKPTELLENVRRTTLG